MGILHLPKGLWPHRILQVCLWVMSLTLIPVAGSASPFFNGDDCCESINKPAKLTLQYTGESCSATDHMQDSDKVSCHGDPGFRSEVRIIISEKSWGGGKVFFDGTVQLDEVFTVSSTTAGEDDFKSETHFTILRTSGSYLQKGKFHTSCSQPLSVGNQFGSLLLLGVTGKDGAECGPPVPETCNAICDAGTIGNDEANCEGYDPAEIVELTPAEACEDNPNPTPAQDCCETTGKPVSIVLKYTGEDCSASQNTQDPDKVDCQGDPNGMQTVNISISINEDGSDAYFSGPVELGETLEAVASAAGESRFKSNTYFRITNLQGTVLQSGYFHTSCSQPLGVGDKFGALELVGLNGEDGDCGVLQTETPEIEYLWLSSTDGCPTDSATQVIDGANDTSYDPAFISQTTWYVRWARTKCTPTPPSGPGCCEDGKPANILLTYTGQGCGATSTSQDPDKVDCSGDANETQTVHITISEESDGDNAYFSGNVNLGESFLADALAIGEDDFKSNTYYLIRNTQGQLLEFGEFHTSCSQPLNVGDQFGSLRLEGFESKNGSICGTTDPGSVGGGDDNFIYSDWSAANCVIKKVEDPIESVSTSNIICDDNGTPFFPGDDVFSFTLTVNGTGSGWNATVNGNITSGSYGSPVSFGPFPISGGNVVVSVTDVDFPNCDEIETISPPDPCSDQQPCTLHLSISNKLCNDNGTPADPSDDTYTFDLTVDGSNGSGNWTGGFNNPFLGAFAIGSTPNGSTINLGPFPIGFNINVNVRDTNDPDCKDNTVVTSPAPCSDEDPCEITADIQAPICNDNGTPFDPSDDFYTFQVTVFSSGDCSTNFWTGGGRSSTYGTTVNFGPYPIGSNQSFTITNADGNAVPVNVTSPQACSNQQPCEITLSVFNKVCNDNGTPADPSDDTYTFDLTAYSTNGSGSWTAAYDNAFLGAFAIGTTPNGTPVNLGPFPIGFDINVYVADANDPDCRDLTVVTSPPPCSNSVSNKIGDFVWNDLNGDGIQDPNEPGIGGVWVILEDCNGVFKDVTVTDGTGMYMFSDLAPGDYKIRFANPGGFIFTLQNSTDDANDNDANVYGYTDCFTVTSTTYDLTYDAGFTTDNPPVCVITGTVGNSVCDDNGTPYDPSDDTFTFEVSATAVNDGGWGWAIPSLNLFYLPLGQPVVVGPFPISGGDVTLTLRDQDKFDCTTTVTGIAPQPCSYPRPCSLTYTISNKLCNDNGTPHNPDDDTYTFDLTANSTNGSGSWTATYDNAFLGAFAIGATPNGTVVNLGPFPIGYDINVYVRDANDSNCKDNTVVGSPQACSTPPVCDNVTDGGKIGGTQTNCGPFDPAPLTNVESPSGGSGTIEYMWLSSTRGCPTSINQAIPGADAATYDPGYLSQTTWFVRCSRRANCTDWTIGESNCIKITIENCPPVCDNVTDGGKIGGTQTNCGPFDPAPLTNVESPSGGSGTIEYMWLSSTTGCPTNINQAIPGAYSATYDPGYLSQTTWFVRCSRRVNCTDWTTGESNCIKITIENCPPVCDNVTNGGQIGGAQSNCGPFDPAPLTSISLPSGGSGAIEYMWLSSTTGCPTSTTQAIPGAHSATYDPGYLSQTTWFVRCSRRANCTDWTRGESNCVKIEVKTNCGNLTFSCGNNISVTADPGETGKVVTFNNPTASTTCPSGNTTVTQIAGPASGSVFPIGTTTVTFRATDDCGNSETCGFNITINEGTPPGDCTDYPSYDCGGVNQGGWEPWWEWISNVKFAGIDHASGKNQYTFWANVAPASVSAGQSYNITLTPGLSWPGYVADLYWRVWIDFNRDGDFDDANELVVEEHAVSQIINATVQVPANAQSGGTRMRIAVQRDQYALACENFSFGEMEDYKVCIDGNDPCVDEGGDTDGDGVCDNIDCAPNDPNLPTTPGTACNDGNPNTYNDVIQSDGCTCAGIMDPCIIDASVSDVLCDDNGTPTYSGDDTYTFKVTVFRTGGCNSNTWSGGGESGITNTATTFGPYPISSGGRSFVITNGDGATTTVSVNPPNTCSNQNPCELETSVTDVICDDNGTPTYPDDDTYTFKLKVTKTGYCTSNHWSGGGTTGAYGTYVTFGPYLISSGGRTFVVSNSDGASTTVSVNPPNTCSNQDPCELDGSISDILCDDNGTPSNPDDDTYTFKLKVTKSGYCTSNHWSGGGITGAYNTYVTFGPYPISGGNTTIVVTNADGASKTFVANAPAPCSDGPEICVVRDVTNNKLCSNNNVLYGLWINADISGHGSLDHHYKVVSGTLTEYADGTAKFTGTFENRYNSNVRWYASIDFGGRTTTAPMGSPKTSNCYNGNGEGFYYYETINGTLIGKGDLQGARLNVTRRGPAFQVGVGANINENDKFGASGWLTLDLISQPYSGHISNLGGGDFNWNLSGPDYACEPIVEVCVEREVTNNKLCSNNNILYGLWIDADISGFGTLNRHYKVVSGTLTEYADGTAKFTGTFENRNNSAVKWYASIDFGGRTTTAPNGSPKTSNCYNGNGDGFYYYETLTGTLTGKGDLEGAEVNVTRRGPAFQVGVGANLNENDKFGASGWLTLDLISQPYSGHINHIGDGDFNWNLSGPDYACVPTPSVCNRTALFVVGSTWLGSGDRAIKERLEHLGFDVHVLDDSDADEIDASGFGVILISSTVSSSKVNNEFRDIDVPVVVYEGWLFDDMKMTGYTSYDFGKWGTSTKLKIVNPGHPLAGGCDGTIEVYNSGQSFHWGKPSSHAIKVAEFTHTGSKYPYFAYEKGAEMKGIHAPARRVGLFIDNYSGPYLTAKGWKLFDASILWASACEPLPVSSRVQDVTQFDATLSQGVVDLSWVNNTGYKTEYFTIEKSMDGVNFEPLTEALPQDESNNARFYKKTDNFPLTGFNYYRLVNHFVDGSFEFSEVRRVRIDDIEDFGLFPNPASDQVNVALKGYEGKDITIQVVDQLGRLVKEEYIDNATDGTYLINISQAGNGIYTLWIFAENSKPVGKKLIITNTY